MNTTQEGLTGRVYLVTGSTLGIREAMAMSHHLGSDFHQLLP
jgi:hypothetical protein